MTRRPGLTMTELLVAIFVVAIGLAGVMSMVPFGAKQMSDALVADRTATLATSIDALVRSYWKDKIADDLARQDDPTYQDREPFWPALDDAGSGLTVPAATEASYPVFLDPMGVSGRLSSDAAQLRVGDGGATLIPRRTMNGTRLNPPFAPYKPPATPPSGWNTLNTQEASLAWRMWSQPDGFSWDENSQPQVVSGLTPSSSITVRELRYNALAVIQRPTNSNRTTATLKIVVFSNRRHQFYPAGSEHVIPKTAGVAFTPGSTALRISSSLLPANVEIRKGGWLMDATIDGSIRHANFYRVVSAADDGSGTLDIELDSPVKRLDGSTGQYNATVVVMPGIAGVFERPELTGNFAP
ncbi:hypothetical protein GobsT_07510 [Gemmata obscuriglobus]|nr:prepilin-type N-terminal cleavage/methylation domain-containing protein [Gemmata obscuriglobus]QEG26016.1 hypothetical protein GobsT_07510 [Gemmata obscuriglobus]VTS00330.1 unnamed protein product [Gemmata obscuriglobus UQM 2246]